MDNLFLSEDKCVEIILDRVQHKAWQEFDNFSENLLEEDFNCYKLATFLNCDEDDKNYLVVENTVNGKMCKTEFTYNSDTHEVSFNELVEVEEGFLEKQVENDLNNLTVKSLFKGEYNNPIIDIITYKNMYDKYPEIKVTAKEQQGLLGEIVNKDNEKKIVEGAVLVPDEPDYDGDVISKEKIEEVAHEWMLNYRNTDLQHTLNNVAYPVESYLLKEDKVVENVDGDSYTLPQGTWILSVKVQDEEVWENVKNNNLTGFSIMGVQKSALQSVEKSAEVAFKKTTLADLEEGGNDWVVPFVSLVDEPAVPKGKLYSLKQKSKKAQEDIEEPVPKDKTLMEKIKSILSFKNNNTDNTTVKTILTINDNELILKEGRVLSSENKNKLEQAFNILADILEDANMEVVERSQDGDKIIPINKGGDVDMTKEELQTMLESFKSELLEEVDNRIDKEQEDLEENESTEEDTQKNKDDVNTEEVDKNKDNDSEIKEQLESLKEKIESLETENTSLKEFKAEVEKKFTTNKSNQPEGQDGDEDEEEVQKNRYETRDRFGRKRKVQ